LCVIYRQNDTQHICFAKILAKIAGKIPLQHR